jgi:putative flippase GtrA
MRSPPSGSPPSTTPNRASCAATTYARPVLLTKPAVRTAFRLWMSLSQLAREGLKFLAVGGCGVITDVGLFNLLMFGGGEGPLHDRPLTAKTLSMVAATIVTYTGNRLWTFRHRQRTGLAREYSLFFLLSGIGLLIGLACLATSRYLLDLEGPLADNVSANLIGLGLASLFRFFAYRRWVFREASDQVAPESSEAVVGADPAAVASTPQVSGAVEIIHPRGGVAAIGTFTVRCLSRHEPQGGALQTGGGERWSADGPDHPGPATLAFGLWSVGPRATGGGPRRRRAGEPASETAGRAAGGDARPAWPAVMRW